MKLIGETSQELPNYICDGGCTDCLSESDGDEAGRSVNPPNVSSSARGLSSGKPHEVPAATSCGATLAKKGVSGRLENAGGGRWVAEVYPHPAMVRMFGLPRIIKYKKGSVAERRKEFSKIARLDGQIDETQVSRALRSIKKQGIC